MPTIIVCSFLVLMIEIRENLKTSAKDKAWTKRAEKLHKRAHAQFAILQTDAFKLHIYEQKDASPCAGKHSSTNSE